MKLWFCIVSTIFISNFFFSSCGEKSHSGNDHGTNIDTLRVVTLNGPLSYFDYRGTPMGIDYENAKRFAEDNEMILEIIVASNIRDLISKLKEGDAHLAAFPVPSIAEFNESIIHCGPINVTRQVIVQKNGKNKIKDVTELIGKEITIEKDSKFHYRLINLNEELGGGIIINTIQNDTISTEDLIDMVARGEIDYTVADSDLATIYQGSYSNLDFSLPISSDQASSWAVAPGLDSLASKIDRWENQTHTSQLIQDIYKGYYDKTLDGTFDKNLTYFKSIDFKKGKPVSDYDDIFKKHSSISGYNWKLLAAIAYCESRFNPMVQSRFGASGLMQVMPSSARAVGIDPGSLTNPDNNVRAASKILSSLDQSLRKKVPDDNERFKFVVAAYNSGLGHILDAMALADKLGMDSATWTGNVSITALMKSRPEYYNDPVVKNGYFRGRETVEFVDNVSAIYDYLNSSV